MLIPCLRQISGTGPHPSAWRRTARGCGSLNLLIFIKNILDIKPEKILLFEGRYFAGGLPLGPRMTKVFSLQCVVIIVQVVEEDQKGSRFDSDAAVQLDATQLLPNLTKLGPLNQSSKPWNSPPSVGLHERFSQAYLGSVLISRASALTPFHCLLLRQLSMKNDAHCKPRSRGKTM
jgi:hypothetical protein